MAEHARGIGPVTDAERKSDARRDATTMPDLESQQAQALGRTAEHPGRIPWAGWKKVLMRTFSEMISDQIGLAAAGCAFYATLALFPAISTLVSLYGLAFDPATVEPQLRVLRDLLPRPAFVLISERVHTLVTQPRGTLTISLIISTLITLWSSSAGTKSILAALNMAYEEKETRSFIRFQATALTMTLCAILGAAMTVALLVFLPAVLDFIPRHFGFEAVEAGTQTLLKIGTPLLLLLFVGCRSRCCTGTARHAAARPGTGSPLARWWRRAGLAGAACPAGGSGPSGVPSRRPRCAGLRGAARSRRWAPAARRQSVVARWRLHGEP